MNSPDQGAPATAALELTVNKQFDEVWQLYGAYTLSESFGHTPGQFELAAGADLGLGRQQRRRLPRRHRRPGDPRRSTTRTSGANGSIGWPARASRASATTASRDPDFYDEAGWYGYLPYHSLPRASSSTGSYTAPFGTTFGLVYEFDSGHAWQKKTFVPFYGYDGFGQGRGTRFMPAVHYVDFRFAHTIELGKETAALEATARHLQPAGLRPVHHLLRERRTRVRLDVVPAGAALGPARREVQVLDRRGSHHAARTRRDDRQSRRRAARRDARDVRPSDAGAATSVTCSSPRRITGSRAW